MGCCLSTNTSSKPPKDFKTTPQNSNISKSPPPTHPILEEETVVKEVLSETCTVPRSPSRVNLENESPFIKKAPLLQPGFSKNANAHNDHRNGVVSKKPFTAFNGGDDVSEDLVSEICSTQCESESVSASTNVTEMREERNDEQLRQSSPAKRKGAAFSGEIKREKTVGRSPGKRYDPSPRRARTGPVSGSGYGRKRDGGGESSERRSRSPMTRADTGVSKVGSGKSPPARKTGKSPHRVGSGLEESSQKVEEERKDGGDNKLPPTSDESLENPFVSLECFIFL